MKHIVKIFLSAVLMCIVSISNLEAQLVVTPANEIQGWSADSLVRNVLLSGGVSVSNVRFNGYSDDLQCNNIGTFQTGSTPTNIGLERGLIIGTGNVLVAVGPNDVDDAHINTNCSGYSDASLEGLATSYTYDEAVLEFDFVTWDSVVSFNYVFGSEEYPEYVGDVYNDVFGFCVTGANPMGGTYNNTNMALIPNTNEVVSINNVNDQYNAAYYISNTGGSTIQYDGFTTLMNVNFRVVPMTQYHIKMGICDVADLFFDSGVFLQANSFESPLSYAMLIEDMSYLEVPDDYYFCANRTISVDIETGWNYDEVKWYFGDGASAYGRSVQHTYAQDGFYEVMNVLYNPHRSTDSIYLTKVIEVRTHEGSEEVFTCSGKPFTWQGRQYTQSGDYTETMEAPDGCDSIVTLHLTIGHEVTTDTVARTCEPFLWYGQTYATSGQYEHLFHTDTGCDSLVTLHLSVGHVVEVDTTVRSCEEFVWNGQTYEESGQYECLLQTSMGCDSIVRLHLTIEHVRELVLQGPTYLYASTDLIYGDFVYYVPDSLEIAYGTLIWSCSNPEWSVEPSESTYYCRLWATNIGQGTLTARIDQDCETVYSLELNATWFDVEENGDVPVKLFPNPTQSEVTVQAEGVVDIKLLDAFGEAVLEENCEHMDVLTLHVGHLPTGVYMVEITTTRGKTTKRLVIAK